MPRFKYNGRMNQGSAISGELEGSSVDAIAANLVGRGIIPIKIVEVSAASSTLRKLKALLGSEKVNAAQLIMFCRQMYTVAKSGIPLSRGMRGLAASIRHEYFRDALNDVVNRLETGVNLSQAMSHHPKIFNPLFISMISVGENSGKLEEVFDQISFYLERDEETKKRIKAAVRYPTFVSLSLLVALITLNILVVPAFAQMFAKFHAELPILTRLLIAVSTLLIHYWPYMLLLVCGVIVALVKFLGTERGALLWGQKKLRLPIIGSLVERASMARYTRSFGLMLRAAVPLAQSLNLCAAAIDNPWLAVKIRKIREGVERGESLLRTHLQAEMFTPLVLQMISVGEESGQLEELFREVAEFYEREVEYDLKTLTDRIEPILIITMAGFIVVLALGIFLPMWSLYDVQAH